MQGTNPCLCRSREGFLQDRAQLAMRECLFKEMKQHINKNPPQSNLCRMLALPQKRVLFGFVVRFCLKNYWAIAQSELRAVLVEKLEAGSGKNNVSNTSSCPSQGFECNNVSTAFNLTRLAQQDNHLLTHIFAMHLVCACCSDKTVVR